MVDLIGPEAHKHRRTAATAYYAVAVRKYRQDAVASEAAARRAYQLQYEVDGEHGVWTNRARILLAMIFVRQNKMAEAKPLIDNAIASAELMYGRTIWWANAKIAEAEYHLGVGDAAAALDSYRAYAGVAARTSNACYFGPCLGPYLDLLGRFAAENPATAPADLAEAFRAAQLVESPVVGAAIARVAARIQADQPEIAALARQQQDIEEKKVRLRAQLTTELARPADKRDAAKETELSAALRALEAEGGERELALQDRFPRYAQLLSQTPVEAERIAALLAPNEALLLTAVVGNRGYTLLLHRGRLALHPVAISSAALTRKVAGLRRGLEPVANGLPNFDVGLAHELYRDVIGPLLDDARSIERLIVVPTGPLLSLPPDVLVAAPPGPGLAVEWLVKRHALVVAPSVKAFADLRAAPTRDRAGPPRFVGVGDPAYARGQIRSAGGGDNPCGEGYDARAQVARFAPLPETADEVRAMAAAVGVNTATLFLGDAATKSALRAAPLAEADVLVFATHGVLPSDLACEAEPGLVLTPRPGTGTDDDGLLRASEVAALKLNAALVILSACSTAGADGQLSGESLSGLVRAFFFAGARNVLATHWPIASEPTVALTTGMVRIAASAKGNAWPEALRQAKLRMLSQTDTAHPLFWGAFSIIGG